MSTTTGKAARAVATCLAFALSSAGCETAADPLPGPDRPAGKADETEESGPARVAFLAVPAEAFVAGEVVLGGHRLEAVDTIEEMFGDGPLIGLQPDPDPQFRVAPLAVAAAVPVGEVVVAGVGFVLVAVAGWWAQNRTRAHFESGSHNWLDVGDAYVPEVYDGVAWAERSLEDLEIANDVAQQRDLSIDAFVEAVAAADFEDELTGDGETLWTTVLLPSLAHKGVGSEARTQADADEDNPCGEQTQPVLTNGRGLLRAPYLQQVGPDRATIMWTVASSSEAPGSVRYRYRDGAWRDAPAQAELYPVEHTHADEDFTQYEATLDGLVPGISYCYEVEVGGDRLAYGLWLRTDTNVPSPTRVLVLGDSGTDGEDTQYALRDVLVQHDAELMIHVGDLAYDPDPRYGGPKPGKPGRPATYAFLDRTFFRAYEDLLTRVPVYPTLGNHEEWAKEEYAPHTDWYPAEPYLRSFSFPCATGVPCARGVPEHGRYYGFDRANMHFAVIDTNPETLGSERYGDPGDVARRERMLAWLEADLDASAKPWKIIVMHQPAWANNDERNQGIPEVRQAIAPIAQRHDVDLVVNGDFHFYERTVPIYLPEGGGEAYEDAHAGVPYLTVGAGGREVEGREEFSWFTAARDVENNSFVRLTVLGCHLYGEAVATPSGGGSVILSDSFYIDGC